jgi:hypothetical protein
LHVPRPELERNFEKVLVVVNFRIEQKTFGKKADTYLVVLHQVSSQSKQSKGVVFVRSSLHVARQELEQNSFRTAFNNCHNN